MRYPLRNQILFPFAGLTTATVVAVAAAGAWYASQAVEARIDAQLHDAARVLLGAEFPLTDRVLKQTRGLSGAEFVLTDAAGRLRASSFVVPPHAITASAPSSGAASKTIVHDGVEYLRIEVPRPPHGAVDEPLRLHVLYPQSLRRELLHRAVWPPVVIGAAAMAAAWGLAYVLATRVSHPLAEVRRRFAALARGEYAELQPPSRNDEIRDLVGSVNHLTRQLAEHERAVRRSARSTLLGQLSGGLCHQLRNAATGAKLALQLHRRCCRTDAESLDVALRQLDMAEQCVERLLTLGKPSPLQLQALDVRSVVADATTLVEPTFHHHGVELRVVVPDRPVVLAQADPEQLRQLLVNLALNAVQAAGPGGWSEIVLSIDAAAVRLRVCDGGAGPPDDVVEHLFEPFVTSKPDGIGLGLAAAQQIATLHGGTIAFSNRPHTCFELVLPLSSLAAEKVGTSPAAAGPEMSP